VQVAADRVAVTAIGADAQANDVGSGDATVHPTGEARVRQAHPRLSPVVAGQAAAVSSLASS
jgi:hypothetical protein